MVVIAAQEGRGESISAPFLTEGFGVRVVAEPVWRTIADAALVVVDLRSDPAAGLTLAAQVRAASPVPILGVLPTSWPEPAVLDAYVAGVDQCVVGDARPHELVARARALLRRTLPVGPRPAPLANDAALSIDLATSAVLVDGVKVSVSPAELVVLTALLSRPGRVVRRDELTGPAGPCTARSLDGTVRSLRSKLEVADGGRRIVAVRGVGFRLVGTADG